MATIARKKAPKVETSAYDVAEHLRTPAEMAAYLDAWLEAAPDDVSGIARALGDIARAKGMSLVAKEAGLSRESLYRALSEGGNPSLPPCLRWRARWACGFTLNRPERGLPLKEPTWHV
jgi:probable addiction module antidote protein